VRDREARTLGLEAQQNAGGTGTTTTSGSCPIPLSFQLTMGQRKKRGTRVRTQGPRLGHGKSYAVDTIAAMYGVAQRAQRAQRAQLVAELVQKGGEGEGSSEEDEPEAELEGCSALYGVAQRAQLVAELVQKGGEGEGSSEEDEPEAELDASSSVGGGVDGDAWASSGPGAVRGHVVRSAAPQTSSGLEQNWPGAYALPQTLLSGDEEERAYVQQLVGGFAGGQPSVLEDGAGVTDVDIGAGEG